MECLPPTVRNNYVTCFSLLTYVGVSNIWPTGYSNALFLGTNSHKKRNVDPLDSTHHAKKQSNFDSGWFARQQSGVHCLLLLNFLNLRDLFDVWIKLKESIFKNNNQINSTVTTRTGFSFERMGHSISNYKIGIRMKEMWCLRLLKRSMFRCWMLFFRMQDEFDESLPLQACNSEIFKGRQISFKP